MIVTFAIGAWLILGLVVALIVGAGTHAPQPHPNVHHLTRTGRTDRRGNRVLHVVGRDDERTERHAGRLLRAVPGRSPVVIVRGRDQESRAHRRTRP